jgi:hypothetical protein
MPPPWCWALLVLLFTSIPRQSCSKAAAQNKDFFRFDTNYPSRSLFPFVDGRVFNIKDLVDDVSELSVYEAGRWCLSFAPSRKH